MPPLPPPAVVADQPHPAPAAFDLARYRDRKRVLVFAAPDARDTALAEEEAALRANVAGVADRDLVVVRLIERGASTAEGQPLGAGDVAALRRRLGVEAGRFTALLVGKDGHVALRSHTPVVAARLFPAIDAMPMRRAEVARRRGGAGGE